MSRTAPRPRLTCGPHSFLHCLRQFLTPDVWKRAHQADGRRRRRSQRWDLQPLLLTLLVLTWCAGDSQPERFETAKAFSIALTHKRRRPGKTLQGFPKALATVPLVVLRALADGLRRRLLLLFGTSLQVAGFIPLGCDGSRLRCPRTAELERRLAQASQATAPPQVWLTALVHLRLGLLWSWWLGKGDASERTHLQRLLPTLPKGALVVTEAGYQGYELSRAVLAQGVQFLTRVSSQTLLYMLEAVPAACWEDGLVYCWPSAAQKQGQPPLLLRRLRVRSPQRKVDVWLLTNVLESTRLPLPLAGQFYRMRWENEMSHPHYPSSASLYPQQRAA